MAFILFIFSWPQKSQLYCNLIIRTAFATISMFVNLMVILFIFVVGAMTERGSNKKPEHEVSSNKKLFLNKNAAAAVYGKLPKKRFFWDIFPKSVYPPTHPRVFVRFGKRKGETRVNKGNFSG